MSARNSRDAKAARRAARDQAEARAKDVKGRRQEDYMTFVRENGQLLVEQAPRLAREHGRGAFIVSHGDEWTPGNAKGHYVTDTAAREQGGWPDETTSRMVGTYDPAKQFVIVVGYSDGTFSAHKTTFAKAYAG